MQAKQVPSESYCLVENSSNSYLLATVVNNNKNKCPKLRRLHNSIYNIIRYWKQHVLAFSLPTDQKPTGISVWTFQASPHRLVALHREMPDPLASRRGSPVRVVKEARRRDDAAPSRPIHRRRSTARNQAQGRSNQARRQLAWRAE